MTAPMTGGPTSPPIPAAVYNAPRTPPRPSVPNSPAVTAGARAMNPPYATPMTTAKAMSSR